MADYKTEEVRPGEIQVHRDGVLVAVLNCIAHPGKWFADLAPARGRGLGLPAETHPQAWRCWDVLQASIGDCLRDAVMNIEFIMRMRAVNQTPSQRKMRVCLKCQREFISEGPGNRICPGCGCGNEFHKGVTRSGRADPRRGGLRRDS